VSKKIEGLVVALGINDIYDTAIRTTWSNPEVLDAGLYVATFIEDHTILAPGRYKLIIGLSKERNNIHYLDTNLFLNISDVIYQMKGTLYSNKAGFIMNPMKVIIEEENLFRKSN
jgi:hypothetical protein